MSEGAVRTTILQASKNPEIATHCALTMLVIILKNICVLIHLSFVLNRLDSKNFLNASHITVNATVPV